MTASFLEQYFREQQVSLQWLPFLRALAGELQTKTDAHTLRTLFASIGERVAQDSRDAFEGVDSLSTLTSALNDFLARIHWGVAELSEIPGGIAISHHGAPLAEAFGDDALFWSIGFLEGFYQAIFGLLGAGPAMRIRALDDESEAMHLRFRFGR